MSSPAWNDLMCPLNIIHLSTSFRGIGLPPQDQTMDKGGWGRCSLGSLSHQARGDKHMAAAFQLTTAPKVT